MMGGDRCEAVVLALRCSNFPAEEVVSQIKELRPNLVGRVLVITGEVTDAQTMDLISRHLLPSVPRSRLMPELWGQLRGILGINPSPKALHS